MALSVTIADPEDGQQVSDTVIIKVDLVDVLSEIRRVNINIDGGAWRKCILNVETDQWEYSWNTEQISNGNHIIGVIALG